jgi:hypothetical protein
MMSDYLDRAADALDGWEFLTMARPVRSATGRS